MEKAKGHVKTAAGLENAAEPDIDMETAVLRKFFNSPSAVLRQPFGSSWAVLRQPIGGSSAILQQFFHSVQLSVVEARRNSGISRLTPIPAMPADLTEANQKRKNLRPQLESGKSRNTGEPCGEGLLKKNWPELLDAHYQCQVPGPSVCLQDAGIW